MRPIQESYWLLGLCEAYPVIQDSAKEEQQRLGPKPGAEPRVLEAQPEGSLFVAGGKGEAVAKGTTSPVAGGKCRRDEVLKEYQSRLFTSGDGEVSGKALVETHPRMQRVMLEGVQWVAVSKA